ncbi:MAG TPA: pyridoxamine 5'-phosphate oxidase family protein [Acidimicrobiales bacterium]|nr:pyridoxamine 5'-phosphate oxidase family protein [Acidimicrobiales bacterium]
MGDRTPKAGRDPLPQVPVGLGSTWIDQRGSEVLERNECQRLLALASRRGDVGRLGIPTDTSPIVVPVNFRSVDRDILVRVGRGTIGTTIPGQLVAFEVDRVEAVDGVAWSVLVRGLARALAPHDRHRPWKELPEPLVPLPGDTLLSIRADAVTGRRFRLLGVPGERWPTTAPQGH